MNISPFQFLSPTTFSTGVQTFLKKLHSRRAVISHLHYTGEEVVAQRGEVTSLRSHSTLLSGTGQEPRAPNSHPRECYVASHRPASRLDMAALRGWTPCGHNPASLLWHHPLSEARKMAHACVASGSLSSRGGRHNNNDSHSFSQLPYPSRSAGRRRAQLRTVALVLTWGTMGKLSAHYTSVSSFAKWRL